jgi:hypothetical protein
MRQSHVVKRGRIIFVFLVDKATLLNVAIFTGSGSGTTLFFIALFKAYLGCFCCKSTKKG